MAARRTFRLSGRRKLALFLVTLSGFAVAVLPADAATPNDPSFCGVRHAGPVYAGGGEFLYEVRNKCSGTYNWKVYLPSVGRYAVGSISGTACQEDPGNNTISSYWAPAADTNWYILNC